MQYMGVELPDDCVKYVMVDGKLEMFINAEGMRILADNAPNPVRAHAIADQMEAHARDSHSDGGR